MFNDCTNKCKFPNEWKKAKVAVHKKGNKPSLKKVQANLFTSYL